MMNTLGLPKKDPKVAYNAGFDCGLNGANIGNSHFLLFSSKENITAWEHGKHDGEAKLKPGKKPLFDFDALHNSVMFDYRYPDNR